MNKPQWSGNYPIRFVRPLNSRLKDWTLPEVLTASSPGAEPHKR
jgi:hypothetical protein